MTITTPPRVGFFTRLLDDVDAGTRYQYALEQIQKAESLGFESAWVAQHHFHREEGGLPSPLVFLAWAAAQTSRIRLGTGVITLPLEDPLHVAEDLSVLDLLSGGRVELGLGTGGTPSSFTAFGLDVADKRELYEEKLAALLTALRGQALPDGANHLYPSAGTLSERIWQATFSVAGGVRAGTAGDGLLLSRTQPRPEGNPRAALGEVQEPIIDAYLAALPNGAEPRILASRTLFVAETREEALRHASVGLPRIVEGFARQGHVFESNDIESLIRATDSHVGTVEDVVESLSADTAIARSTDVTFQVHSIDPPHEAILASLELAATQVFPRLGWTLNGAATPALAS